MNLAYSVLTYGHNRSHNISWWGDSRSTGIDLRGRISGIHAGHRWRGSCGRRVGCSRCSRGRAVVRRRRRCCRGRKSVIHGNRRSCGIIDRGILLIDDSRQKG